MDEGEAELDVLHLLFGVFAVPGVETHRTALGGGDEERQFSGGDDREAAGLVARVDVGDVGDTVARHVVMVEGFAELLGRIDLVMQRAPGLLLDRGAPIFQRLLQRMRRRYPVRQLELESLFLRERAGRGADERGDGGGVDRSGETGFHRTPPSELVAMPTFLIFSRMSVAL